tara:strand:+ start:125 stop:361 length:237 start_codon:yes stop_codon:yes gene_type:complete
MIMKNERENEMAIKETDELSNHGELTIYSDVGIDVIYDMDSDQFELWVFDGEFYELREVFGKSRDAIEVAMNLPIYEG